MKRTKMVIYTFTVCWMMSSLALAHAPDFNAYEVTFNPNPSKGELVASSNNMGCTKGQGQKKGCVNFPKDTLGLITFSVANKLKQCSDPGTKWVITRVELSHSGLLLPDGTTLSEKGIFGGNLPSWLEDAFPQVNPTTGILYEVSDKLDGVTRVTSLNLNNNTGAKDIWYQVTVSNCDADSDVVLVSDPRFENEGKN